MCVYEKRDFRRRPLRSKCRFGHPLRAKVHAHLEHNFFLAENHVNSCLECDFKRSTVKQTRKMHMDVCVYGPFWRSAPHKKCRNAPYTHTHIHTHFCFLFSRPQTMLYASLYLGKSALFTREECTFGTWLGHPKMLYTSLDFGKSASLCVNNALLGNFGGHKTSFKPKTT